MKLKAVSEMQLGQQDGFLLSDECIDVATIEQMAICIRFVDSYGEDFKVRVGYVELMLKQFQMQ